MSDPDVVLVLDLYLQSIDAAIHFDRPKGLQLGDQFGETMNRIGERLEVGDAAVARANTLAEELAFWKRERTCHRLDGKCGPIQSEGNRCWCGFTWNDLAALGEARDD